MVDVNINGNFQGGRKGFLDAYTVTLEKYKQAIADSCIHGALFDDIVKHNVIVGCAFLKHNPCCTETLNILNMWAMYGVNNLYHHFKIQIESFFNGSGHKSYSDVEIKTFVGHLWDLIQRVNYIGADYMSQCRDIIKTSKLAKVKHLQNLALILFILNRVQSYNHVLEASDGLDEFIILLNVMVDFAHHVFEIVDDQNVKFGLSGLCALLMAQTYIYVFDGKNIMGIIAELIEKGRELIKPHINSDEKPVSCEIINSVIGYMSVVLTYFTGYNSIFLAFPFNPLMHLQHEYYDKLDYLVNDHMLEVDRLIKAGHQFYRPYPQVYSHV